jgi:hypothetical protein
MRLHEVVAYLEQIDRLDLDGLRGRTQRGIDQLNHVITNNPAVGFKKINQFVVEHGHGIDRAFETYSNTVNDLKRICVDHIQQLQADCLRESMRLWQHEMPMESAEYILERRMQADSESLERINGRMQRWKDWRVPGAVFGARREAWIDRMVDTDPLYLVDTRSELLDPPAKRFNPQYESRLRKVVVEERLKHPLLWALPDQQIGYVFAYNYFNYKPLELIYQYLEELYIKLRPGGVVFMTINDCDYAHGTALFEVQHFMCYTPGSWIASHAAYLGFELVDRYRGTGDVAWLEFRKPGEMTSIKGGQTMAKILTE